MYALGNESSEKGRIFMLMGLKLKSFRFPMGVLHLWYGPLSHSIVFVEMFRSVTSLVRGSLPILIPYLLAVEPST